MATTFLTLSGNHDGEVDIKLEPETYDEVTQNRFVEFDNTKRLPSTTDMGALNLWTSKATSCLIAQYKRHRSLVGQSTKIRSLREMFEMVSFEMQKFGFYFSAQKCENKWRVLERKYKNLVFRERLKKPGRMRHYGHWEHRRALDEIFNQKKRLIYLDESDFPSSSSSAKIEAMMQKSAQNCNFVNNATASQPTRNNNTSSNSSSASYKRIEEAGQTGIMKSFLEKFVQEVTKNFAIAEKNNERRHNELLAARQLELEVRKRLLKVKEDKLKLKKAQIVAAAQHLSLNV